MTDEQRPSDIIADNLDKIIAMTPEEHEAFAKAELGVMFTNLMGLPEIERVEVFYNIITDRLNRVYMFGYENGYKDGHERGRFLLN